MHRGSILTKTGKGLMEATGKTSNLSREQRNVLKEIDGQVSVSKLLDRLEKLSEPKLLEVLRQLEIEHYVREFVGSEEPRASTGRPSISQPPADADDLDFTSLGSLPAAPSRPGSSGPTSKPNLAGPSSKPNPAGPSSKPNPAGTYSIPNAAGPSSRVGEDEKLQTQAQEIARQVQARRAHDEAAARARTEAETLHRKVADARARKAAEEKARQEIAIRMKVDTASGASALDRARQEAEERRREADDKARLEAEVRARVELELGIKREVDERPTKESAERAQRELAERVARDAEERARREREERARAEQAVRLEAEARAKLEVEMRVRREMEERARREADQRAQHEEMTRRRAAEEVAQRRQLEEDKALERSLREQEENARREAEHERQEQERKAQEERDRREAEEKARGVEAEKQVREQERQARDEERTRAKARAKAEVEAEAGQEAKPERAKEKAGEDSWRGDEPPARPKVAEAIPARRAWAKRKPRSMLKQLPALAIVVLIVAVAAIPLISLEKAPFEKAAQTWLGQPVKIGGVSWSLFPTPQLKFEKVAIGKDAQMRAAVIRATPEILSLFADRKVLRTLDLENANFPREFLPAMLIVRGEGRSLGVERITAKGLKLEIPELKLAAMDLDAAFAADGSLKTVNLVNAERKLSVKLEPQRGRTAIEISSGAFPLSIGLDPIVGDFAGKGTLTRSELVLNEVEARAFGGKLLGSLRLRWSDGWIVDGSFTARQLEAGKLAAPLLTAGSLDGKAAYSMRAAAPEKLLGGARLEGTFIVHKGSIANIDMTRLIQGGSSGGTTSFADMSGTVLADSSRVSVRQIRLAAGLMNGTGQLDMDSQSRLSGRLQLELRSAGARATLGVGGTLANPQYRRN